MITNHDPFYSETELNRGGQLSPEMVNQNVDLKFFPLAPVEKDLLNRVSVEIIALKRLP